MTHEIGKPTFQSPRVSHEIKFLALFIHLPVLKQQHCPQISFSVCFVPLSLPPSSHAFLTILQALVWLLSFFPLPKVSSLFSTQED